MTLIEGLKTLKVLTKRIDGNAAKIKQYCAKVSTEKPYFETEEVQKVEVQKLTQANIDLTKQYMTLKQRLDRSNIEIKVEMQGKTYSISELLMYKRFGCQWVLNSINCLNETQAQGRLRTAPPASEGKQVYVERLYDEREKNGMERQWREFFDSIDSKLEIVNATTDLVE